MAGVLTLLSVLYGLSGIAVTLLAALHAYHYLDEFAANSGTVSCERGAEFVGRPDPKQLRRRAIAIGICFILGLAVLIVFAVAGLGLDRPTFSTHYTLKVLGRTYEEANVALFALLPISAAACAALAAFAIWRRLRMLERCRVCLTADSLYGVSFEPNLLGCRAVLFDIRYADITCLRDDGNAVILEARARSVRVPVCNPPLLLQAIAARTELCS